MYVSTGVSKLFSKGVTALINQLTRFFTSKRQHTSRWELPLAGLLLTGCLVSNASSLEAATPQWQESRGNSENFVTATVAQAPTPDPSIPDGTYLYGQSSQPEQIGQEYIVFEARQGKLIGALYMPHSEFSCFYGSVDAQQMNLTVVNPYDQTAISHTIARERQSPVAAVGGQINLEDTYDSLTYPYRVQLEGYQPIPQLAENDERILSTCLDNYREQVWGS